MTDRGTRAAKVRVRRTDLASWAAFAVSLFAIGDMTVPSSLVGQGACSPAARVGYSLVGSRPPQGDAAGGESGRGGALGVGLRCGGLIELGGEVEVHLTGGRAVWFFLVGAGARVELQRDGGGPAVSVLVQGGPFLSRDRRGPVLAGGNDAGEFVDLDDEGFAYGAAGRFIAPINRRWAVLGEVAVRAASFRTRTFGAEPIIGSHTEVRIPLTVGLQWNPPR